VKAKRMAVVAAALILAAVAPAGRAAAEEGTSAGVDLAYAERYIWRGIPVNDQGVFQPSFTLSGGGFSLNAWGSMDLTSWGERAGYGDETGSITEVDYTAGYERSVGPASLGLGFITYTFPNQTELGAIPTTEAYLGAGLDVPLSPTLYTCWDVDDQGTEGSDYTALGLGHSFELGKSGDAALGLDLAAHLGYANSKFLKAYYGLKADNTLHDWSAGVALPLTLPRGFSVSPSYAYSSLMNDQCRRSVNAAGHHPEAGTFVVTLGWSGGISKGSGK
jgi:uncharacterized protein (TIGR02001 family)